MILKDLILEQLLSVPPGKDPDDFRNTQLFNILQANPSTAIFCADVFRENEANPNLLKDLRFPRGIFDPDRSSRNQPTKKGPDAMPSDIKIQLCTHIKVNGIPCGAPALRGEVFCYFHQRMIRGVRTPPKSRLHPIAMLEDQHSIQSSLMEVINALVRNQIDMDRAWLILRALHIAVKNANNLQFDCLRNQMVEEIPEYPAAPPPAGPFSLVVEQAAALSQINIPQEEESEADRLDAYFSTPLDLPERKLPARVKTRVKRSRPLPSLRGRTG